MSYVIALLCSLIVSAFVWYRPLLRIHCAGRHTSTKYNLDTRQHVPTVPNCISAAYRSRIRPDSKGGGGGAKEYR